MKKAQARSLISYWKKKLGLDAWDFHVVFDDDPSFAPCGECTPCPGRQKATILLAWPHPVGEDLEQTIVHEELHCYFNVPEGTPPESYTAIRLEQGVDMVADLLVRLDREARK